MRDVDFSHLDPQKLAYVAGLVDGEGSIGIAQFWQGGWGPYYTLRVRVGMTHKPTIVWLRNLFGGSIHSRKDDRGNRKNTHTVCWSDARGRGVLTAIWPWLITKQKQAEVAFELEATRVSKGNDGKRTKKVIAKQRAIMRKIQHLNRRGLAPA